MSRLLVPPRASFLMRLVRDRRGVSAVEFALIAPIMIGFYFGLAEICQGYMADRRTSHAASMVGDLVAQADAVTAADVTDIFQIGALIMRPFPTDELQMRVSSIMRGNDGVARVLWSRGSGMTSRPVDEVVTVPDGLIDNGESLILAESAYDYDSPIDYLIPTVTHFTHTFYLRPRSVEMVSYTP